MGQVVVMPLVVLVVEVIAVVELIRGQHLIVSAGEVQLDVRPFVLSNLFAFTLFAFLAECFAGGSGPFSFSRNNAAIQQVVYALVHFSLHSFTVAITDMNIS